VIFVGILAERRVDSGQAADDEIRALASDTCSIDKTEKCSDHPSITLRGLADGPRAFHLLRSRLLSSVSLAVAATAAAVFDAALSPASAQCTGPPSSTTCTPAGNPYPGGINVDTNNGLGGTPINLTLQSGVIVNIPAGPGGVNAVNAANSTGVTLGSANIIITADGVTINNAANPLSNNNTGLRIQSSGDAIITATNTTINVAGTASEDAILAFAMPNLTGIPHVASVTWNGGALTSSGTEATGIQADNRGIGNATIVASGNISGTAGVGGAGFYGLIAHAGDSLLVPSGAGDASVTYSSGTINVFGNRRQSLPRANPPSHDRCSQQPARPVKSPLSRHCEAVIVSPGNTA